MHAFPLQHKKMQRLVLPYLQVGTCEVMNASPYAMMDSFHALNSKNTSVYKELAAGPASVPFMGQLVAGGLTDSYTGGAVARFVSSYLARAMSLHTIVPEQMRELRREFPEDPLVELMLSAAQRHRAMHQPHSSRPPPQSRAHVDADNSLQLPHPASLRSVMSDSEMQQYAVSTDAAFFKACDVLMRTCQRSLGDTVPRDDDNGASGGGAAIDGRPQRRATQSQGSRTLTLYEKHVAETLAKAIEDSAASSPPTVTGSDGADDSLQALEAVRDSGCRAVWFSATVAPTALELQRRLALLREPSPHNGGGGVAPPPRRSVDGDEALLLKEIEQLRQVLAEQPFCLDVLVSNLGDARAFGVARNPYTTGSKSLLDPTRERVVPLSIDHRPFRQEEFHRIVQAGGKVDSAAGEVIDGNPFYNVSRSFGHWRMKNNPRRSPVQQKLSAAPHTASWRMLAGDVLVLANHAVFQTRHEEDSSIDEVAKVVGRELDRGAAAEQVAAAVCDFAVRFGAPHSLQVMVALATKPDGNRGDEKGAVDGGGAGADDGVGFREWVEPGPLYVEACRQLPALRDTFQRDCARCGVSAADMVRKRWERVRAVLPLRHTLSLMPYYGRECGVLQQIMDEEAAFFDQDVLRRADESLRAGQALAVSDHVMHETFNGLARSLLGAKRF